MTTLLYLIEILHQTTTCPLLTRRLSRCILSKFYIKPQQLLIVLRETPGCILSKFYIKPQLRSSFSCSSMSCILSKFYIKPQQPNRTLVEPNGCILSKFYIKPQQCLGRNREDMVVSYRNSTSNHNLDLIHCDQKWLYLIEILHQTTTSQRNNPSRQRCILSKFYIKPQLDG